MKGTQHNLSTLADHERAVPHKATCDVGEGDTDIAATLDQLVREVEALRVELHLLLRERGVPSASTAGVRRLLSRRQAARMLGVDRAKLGRWVREGRVRDVQLDGVPRIPMAEVERLEREGLPASERQRPRRHRRKGTSKMTPTEITAELAKF